MNKLSLLKTHLIYFEMKTSDLKRLAEIESNLTRGEMILWLGQEGSYAYDCIRDNGILKATYYLKEKIFDILLEKSF